MLICLICGRGVREKETVWSIAPPTKNDPHAAALVLLFLILQSLCCHVLASLFDCLANRREDWCETHVSSHHL